MLAIVASPSATEQHFVLYDGANALLTVADLPQSYITDATVFVFGSVTLACRTQDKADTAAGQLRERTGADVFDTLVVDVGLVESSRMIAGTRRPCPEAVGLCSSTSGRAGAHPGERGERRRDDQAPARRGQGPGGARDDASDRGLRHLRRRDRRGRQLSGLRLRRRSPGLTPWATAFRPTGSGTQLKP